MSSYTRSARKVENIVEDNVAKYLDSEEYDERVRHLVGDSIDTGLEYVLPHDLCLHTASKTKPVFSEANPDSNNKYILLIMFVSLSLFITLFIFIILVCCMYSSSLCCPYLF